MNWRIFCSSFARKYFEAFVLYVKPEQQCLCVGRVTGHNTHYLHTSTSGDEDIPVQLQQLAQSYLGMPGPMLDGGALATHPWTAGPESKWEPGLLLKNKRTGSFS